MKTSRLSLRTRLALIVAIPALAVLVLALRGIEEKAAVATGMERLATLVEVAVRIGALTHELQKERGMSAGFIGSQGAKFARELPAQRKAVDASIGALDATLDAFDSGGYGRDLQGALSKARAGLGELAAWRAKVDGLDLAVAESGRQYSGAIAALLEVPRLASSLSTDATVARAASAYSSLLMAKEKAGQERALLSAVYAADHFTPANFNAFVAGASAQEVYAAIFLGQADAAQRAFYAQQLDDRSIREIERLRQRALESAAAPALGVEPTAWFALASERIDRLKRVEDRLAGDLQSTAATLMAEARRLMWLFITLAAATLLVSAGLAWRIIGNILRQLGAEPDEVAAIARAIAEGDMGSTIRLRAGDTHSTMAEMKQMQDAITAFIEAQAEMARKHAEGRVDAMIDVARFPGSYGEMAAQVNSLSRAHQDDKDKMVDLIMEYANGNFSRDMERFPHAKARLTEAMDDVKCALLAISNDIATVAGAGVAGDFGKRIDESRYQFMFRDIARNLNGLIGTCDVGFNDVLRVARALADGDLSQTISREYPGVFGETRAGVNATVAALSTIISEIHALVEAAATRGDFSVKLELLGKKGYARELSELLNELSNVTDTGLRDVMRVSHALAIGDLTQSIARHYPGVFGQTREGVNDTVDHLRDLVADIQSAVGSISRAATEIADGNTDLSQRTEEQASSLEETASSMEELAATVAQNAESARQASQLAAAASGVAQKGGAAVAAVVHTMNTIRDSSHRIAGIIAVIDGIAFQTNLLALNAAVEAARAGEQGRGFAVVASEVRNLAQGAASAAREIKDLISHSVQQVDGGSLQVEAAGRTMEEIVGAVGRVTDIIAEIAASATEQSSGIAQVNLAVSQMDAMTQQNAALVEQAAAAAESLQEQAMGLAEAVGVFRLEAA